MPIKYYPLKVIQKVYETKNSCSFYFSVPEEYQNIFLYQAAQFLSFKFHIDGKDYVRSYSLASSPLTDKTLRTTVALVDQGRVSQYMLDQINVGDIIESQEPMGCFFNMPKGLTAQNYTLFAAGIGITPLFSILKTLLASQLAKNIFLIFSFRESQDFIYQKELNELQKTFKNQLHIKCIVSSQEGRINSHKLDQVLTKELCSTSFFYLCGPKDYMTWITKQLLNKSCSKDKIFTEDFQVVPIRGPKPDKDSIFFTASSFQDGEPSQLRAYLNEEHVSISLNREKSLLEQLIDQGYNPPFSCTSGSCMSCMAKLKEGKVFQLEEGILDEDNIKQLEILTCQCYPLSKTVSIDYDNL